MPHEAMNVQQVARYLHLTAAEVEKLAERGDLPGRKAAKGWQFRKGQVDHWVETRLRELTHQRMAQIEKGVSLHHGMDPHAPIVEALIPRGGVLVPLPARTRDAAIRCLVEAADRLGLVYDKNDLVEQVRHRETLCPTTLGPGIALPHPRHSLPYDIASSFIIVGRTDSGIPFGCPDGTLTRLFFLICCKDDRTHLHVLARVSRILEEPIIAALLQAADADELLAILHRREQEILASER